ncbi:retinol dehydrogenase 8 [Xylariales sp. PMI_506]|nr:retinol dehydrogenase 8 [Xylariales sp. PMI_506]
MDKANTLPYHLPSDAVWFITGCSSGIGQSLAQLIASTSNRVVATARKPASLSAIPDGPNVLKLALDVTSTASIDAAVDAAVAAFGRLDVVVNNAGYSLAGDTEAAGDAESRALVDTNFWGVVDVTKRALGVMRDENPRAEGGQRGGVVLNISSMGGFVGFPGSAFYHASKFAVEGWTEAVAKELPVEWNIHLCNIEPGGVKTNYATASLQMMEKRHPAYSDPSFPSNVLLDHMRDERWRETWAEPSDVARAMYEVVSRGQRIPIRLPLGPDSWGMLVAEVEKCRREFDEFKDLSLSVGDPKQSAMVQDMLVASAVEGE